MWSIIKTDLWGNIRFSWARVGFLNYHFNRRVHCLKYLIIWRYCFSYEQTNQSTHLNLTSMIFGSYSVYKRTDILLIDHSFDHMRVITRALSRIIPSLISLITITDGIRTYCELHRVQRTCKTQAAGSSMRWLFPLESSCLYVTLVSFIGHFSGSMYKSSQILFKPFLLIGISQAVYWEAVRNGGDIEWRCTVCLM